MMSYLLNIKHPGQSVLWKQFDGLCIIPIDFQSLIPHWWKREGITLKQQMPAKVSPRIVNHGTGSLAGLTVHVHLIDTLYYLLKY